MGVVSLHSIFTLNSTAHCEPWVSSCYHHMWIHVYTVSLMVVSLQVLCQLAMLKKVKTDVIPTSIAVVTYRYRQDQGLSTSVSALVCL